MKTFKCRGTLGDSYIVNCVVHGLASQEPILIKQCEDFAGNAADKWQPHIRQIYSLMPNINVEFVDKAQFESLGLPRLWPSIPKAVGVGVCQMNPHPTFSFPETAHVEGTDYIAFSPVGGKANEEHRHVGFDETVAILDKHPEHKFVLVGDNPEFRDFEHSHVTNLIGKTSILEAMGIVARANKFIGVQGLMAYVAVSQKVPSAVYTKSVGYDRAFRSRLFPEWESYCTVFKTRRDEDRKAWARFIG